MEWAGQQHRGSRHSIGFIVGDWLVYGQSLFGTDGFPDKRVDPASYELAVAATGLDLSTLQNYVYVSCSIPYSLRTERLSWEHHRLLPKLAQDQQTRWIETCLAEAKTGRRVSTRRLRKSLNLGRIATDANMVSDPADKGIENRIPFLNQLAGWWRRMQQDRFLDNATPEQREALKRDLEPGAYTLVDGQIRGTAPARNVGAMVWIPTENEWFKAACYDPTHMSGAGGYWLHANQSDSMTSNSLLVAGAANS